MSVQGKLWEGLLFFFFFEILSGFPFPEALATAHNYSSPIIMTSSKPKMADISLKLLSLKAKGLYTPEKRSLVLTAMRTMKSDIIYLQETHFRTNAIPKFSNHSFPHSFHATSPISKSKGVSILLSKNVPIKITDSLIDDQGRYISLKGTFRNTPNHACEYL